MGDIRLRRGRGDRGDRREGAGGVRDLELSLEVSKPQALSLIPSGYAEDAEIVEIAERGLEM